MGTRVTKQRIKANQVYKRSGTYVLVGFIAVWFLAASPMRRSLSVNATYEGVVRFP